MQTNFHYAMQPEQQQSFYHGPVCLADLTKSTYFLGWPEQ